MIYFYFSEILYLIHKLSKISYDWLETVYENHKINCKIFQHPMEKIFITLWDVWIHINKVFFRKIHLNPFLVIEKVTLNFQNLQNYMIDSFLQIERNNILQMVEKWIRWISLINERFKLNFDGLRIKNKSDSWWIIRDSNGTMEIVTSRHISNVSIIITKWMTLRNDTLANKNTGFLNLEIEGDLRIVIDWYKFLFLLCY